MIYNETKLNGCFVLEPKIFKDNRGYFFESFNSNNFNTGVGAEVKFVQDNQSFSTYGVLRGLHYQSGNEAQAKLVRVLKGKVLDVVVDLRDDSSTYGEHVAVELSGDNKKQLFVPRGFAHGFVVLSQEVEFFYKCDNYYNKTSERGIIYDDVHLAIDWKIDKNDIIISEKDMELPFFKDSLI
jgi:dTDP-4-dehydrorhamnose 3,5-epimerase